MMFEMEMKHARKNRRVVYAHGPTLTNTQRKVYFADHTNVFHNEDNNEGLHLTAAHKELNVYRVALSIPGGSVTKRSELSKLYADSYMDMFNEYVVGTTSPRSATGEFSRGTNSSNSAYTAPYNLELVVDDGPEYVSPRDFPSSTSRRSSVDGYSGLRVNYRRDRIYSTGNTGTYITDIEFTDASESTPSPPVLYSYNSVGEGYADSILSEPRTVERKRDRVMENILRSHSAGNNYENNRHDKKSAIALALGKTLTLDYMHKDRAPISTSVPPSDVIIPSVATQQLYSVPFAERSDDTNTREADVPFGDMGSVTETVEVSILNGTAYVRVKTKSDQFTPVADVLDKVEKSTVITTRGFDVDLMKDPSSRKLYRNILEKSGRNKDKKEGRTAFILPAKDTFVIYKSLCKMADEVGVFPEGRGGEVKI